MQKLAFWLIYTEMKCALCVCGCQLARNAYRDVDARLFDKYVEEKAGPVIGALEQNMYVGMFDWSATYHVTGIAAFLKLPVHVVILLYLLLYFI